MTRKAQHIAVTIFALSAISTAADAKSRAAKPVRAEPAAAGDAAAGSQVFATNCAACHGKQAEGAATAPALRGIVGAKAASSLFTHYTPALKASGVVWSPAKLDSFLAAPDKVIPGTAMVISVPKADDRRNLIAYLMPTKK